MTEQDIRNLSIQLDERTIKLMERESELADRLEEIESQKEELTAAIEELASKNKELTERNAELDQLLYRTSHDLRTPTASLTGIIHLIEKEKIPAELSPYINHIKSLNALMGRVLDALNMMRKAALDEVVIADVNLIQVTEQALQSLVTHPKYEWVQIRTAFPTDPVIKSDKDMLTILATALISNAISFRNIPNGKVNASWIRSNQDIQFTVEDDGEGINSKNSNKIFDMFYRGSPNSVGTGMGLYTAKRIVERLQGKMEWSSQTGLTIFKVSIPS